MTLRQWISQNGTLTWDQAVERLIPLMEELSQMHKNGSVHLQLCPDTIRVREDGTLALLPFTEYKVQDVNDLEELPCKAKKGYSATEFVFNDSGIGSWSDVYSIAGVLVYCLTGKDPVDGAKRKKNRKAAYTSEKIELSLDQGTILEKAISPDPQVRYQKMDPLAQDMKRYCTKNQLRIKATGIAVCAAAALAVFLIFRAFNSDINRASRDHIVIPTPYPERQLEELRCFAVGGDHTAFATKDGELWMTGLNADGELGDGTKENQGSPVFVTDQVQAVDAAWKITAILKEDGTLWMCGSNEDGQFGDGTLEGKGAPVQVMEGVKAVSTGWKATAILKEDGTLWTCGYNDAGQLGDGTQTSQRVPVKILEDVKSVSAGWKQMAALKNDGTLWVWGRNDCGQLGDGTTKDRLKPVQIMENVKEAGVGWKQMAILQEDGTLWTCGRNDCGQLGVGIKDDQDVPVRAAEEVAVVRVGFKEMAVLKEDGTLWVCGLNDFGQLGTGSKKDHAKLTKVMDHVKDADLGTDARVLVVTREDGTVYACGSNGNGALGDGTFEDSMELKEIWLGKN